MKKVSDIINKIMEADICEVGYIATKNKVAHIINESLEEFNIGGKRYFAEVRNGKDDIYLIFNEYSPKYYYGMSREVFGRVHITFKKDRTEYNWLCGNMTYYKVKTVEFDFYRTEEKENILKVICDFHIALEEENEKTLLNEETVINKNADFIERYKNLIVEFNSISWEERNIINSHLNNWRAENNLCKY